MVLMFTPGLFVTLVNHEAHQKGILLGSFTSPILCTDNGSESDPVPIPFGLMMTCHNNE